ncbi:MAG: hypothetical protein A3I31_02160 [Candidatus Colwellbacteria bacterium RIFCSPLOWO2_02_FULL_44_20b]|uniref:Uncharacterized protein n=1 Tax=Candidatus Colwellbacteria bacterium RIFCSPLOWO2_02_FULL_44_20b TaxID=1797691 RepID=A0A1G1Z6J8_9BACT|nr:MAG: hypothetical protein A3I31_02160 [Candidatus Colwellbacteria bacterium RIFCSPLOWO2_02_FULL_44_20b]
MALSIRATPLDFAKASFRTHLNYIKCLEKLFASSTLSVSRTGIFTKRNVEITRFRKLYKVTLKSIKKDIELAREDSAFAVIAAPWFPVKCYYALYYLESILTHLLDGSVQGFGKGGHAGIRKKIYSLVDMGFIVFSVAELNRVYELTQIRALPAINVGQNARSDYWQKTDCINSVAKKLMDYKLHDVKIGRKWNLRTKKHRDEQKSFVGVERLMIADFFFWYRIKANYRDLDYIDFENGITETEVLEYLETYNKVFEYYRIQLIRQITKLEPPAVV